MPSTGCGTCGLALAHPPADAWCVPLSAPISPIRAPGSSRWTVLTLTKSPSVCDDIMREFGVAPMACSPTGHIINGHTPVKTTKGEQPSAPRASCWSSMAASAALTIPRRARRLYAHLELARLPPQVAPAFTTVAEALTRNVDIESETNRFDQADRRRMVSDTDTGAKIRSQIQDLRQLLDAYRNGAIEERT